MSNNLGQSLESLANAAALSSREVNGQFYEHQAVSPEDLSQENWRAEQANGSLQHTPGTMQSGGVPAIQALSLPEVYAQSGVSTPAHGFTILKLADMLGSAHIRDLPMAGKRSSILMALEASNVQLNDVLEDGAKRESALNDYEARQQQAFQDFKAQKLQQNQEIEAEMERFAEACRSRIQANQKEVSMEKARIDEWRTKKREEERRIRSAASPFATNGAAHHLGKTEPAVEAAALPADLSQSDMSAAGDEPGVPLPQAGLNGSNGKATSDPMAGKNGKRSSFWKR
jgi:hypothetical protein